MLLCLTYQVVCFVLDLVLVRTLSDAQLRAEVLALRHQLRVMERKTGKPAWQPADRVLLAGLSRLRRREVLDHLLIFSARHLEGVITEFLVHYHQARPHQDLEQRCPDSGPAVVPLPVGSRIVRHDRLGGLLHEFARAA